MPIMQVVRYRGGMHRRDEDEEHRPRDVRQVGRVGVHEVLDPEQAERDREQVAAGPQNGSERLRRIFHRPSASWFHTVR